MQAWILCFEDYLAVAEDPVILDSATVTENREAWIEAWTESSASIILYLIF